MLEGEFVAPGIRVTSGPSARSGSSPVARSPSPSPSDETEAAALQPAVTVGLHGSPGSVAAARAAEAQGREPVERADVVRAARLGQESRRRRTGATPRLGPVARAAASHGRRSS